MRVFIYIRTILSFKYILGCESACVCVFMFICAHKIIIIKECSKRAIKQILLEYKNAEFFFEHEMLEDIPSKIIIPKHQLLSKDEVDELLTKFDENELSIIYNTNSIKVNGQLTVLLSISLATEPTPAFYKLLIKTKYCKDFC